MQKSDYRDTFAISQSAIKAFHWKGLKKFKKIYIDGLENDDDQDKYAFGSLVDTLAFEEKLLDERFYIPDEEVHIPGDKVKLVADKVFKEAKVIVDTKRELNEKGNLPEPLYIPPLSDLYEWRDLIFKVAREVKYGGTTWSRTRIVDNVYDEASSYFRMLGISDGRSIITANDNADAIEMVEALRTNQSTLPYFVQQEGETLLFQTEIFLEYSNNGVIVPLKGAIDIIRIIHAEKRVQIPDLKTTYDLHKFNEFARNYGYCTQAAFYSYLVRKWLETYEGGAYKDYTIDVPMNIAIDRTEKIPYIFEYTWDDIETATSGCKTLGVKGWVETLEEIAWHIQTGIWNRPKELVEKGKIKLKIY